MKLHIFRDLAGVGAPESVEFQPTAAELPPLPDGLLRVLLEADRSDPLNQCVVAYLKSGNFAARVTLCDDTLAAGEIWERKRAEVINCFRQVIRDYPDRFEVA